VAIGRPACFPRLGGCSAQSVIQAARHSADTPSMDATALPELAAGGSLFGLVIVAVLRVLQGDRDWSRLIDAEREARREADARADEEEARRIALEAELRAALRRNDELEHSVRKLKAQLPKKPRRAPAVA
jgi:hypothetical protein